MSYVKNRSSGMPAQLSLGGVGDLLSTTANVANDPCLGQVTQMTLRLKNIVEGPSTPSTPTAPTVPVKPGIGLCNAVGPLRVATYIAERPWIVPLSITVVFAALIGIGAQIGRR